MKPLPQVSCAAWKFFKSLLLVFSFIFKSIFSIYLGDALCPSVFSEVARQSARSCSLLVKTSPGFRSKFCLYPASSIFYINLQILNRKNVKKWWNWILLSKKNVICFNLQDSSCADSVSANRHSPVSHSHVLSLESRWLLEQCERTNMRQQLFFVKFSKTEKALKQKLLFLKLFPSISIHPVYLKQRCVLLPLFWEKQVLYVDAWRMYTKENMPCLL